MSDGVNKDFDLSEFKSTISGLSDVVPDVLDILGYRQTGAAVNLAIGALARLIYRLMTTDLKQEGDRALDEAEIWGRVEEYYVETFGESWVDD